MWKSMATTEADTAGDKASKVDIALLPKVRRLEAVGFRAWPAASVQYDGSWQVRLTAGHPSKRVNSVVPLDPYDCSNLDTRIEKAARRFLDYGRPLTFRQTPLMAPQIVARLRETGWVRIEESLVMSVDLADMDLSGHMDHLPSHDIGRFVDGMLVIEGEAKAGKAGLAEILHSIRLPNGLFLAENPADGPVAGAICVLDNDLAGIMQLAVAVDRRRQGFGAEILASALRWARISGASRAWLQVTASNAAARALYDRFGFVEEYRYAYWRRGSEA